MSSIYVKDFLNKKKFTADSKSDYLKDLAEGSFFGSCVGLGLGLIYAYKYQKNYFLSGFIGMVATGMVATAFIAYPQSDKTTTTS